MKTFKLIILVFLVSYGGFSQVGIGNTDPKSSLDITASNTITPASTDGILIPRIDNFPAVNPTADQDGMMVFVTGNGTPSKGFYYWDNGSTSWVSVTGVKKIDDLEDGKSDNDNSDDGSSIYLGVLAGQADDSDNNRNVGIGFNAMGNNISGFNNTAIGYQSLMANFTGFGNTALGAYSLWNTTGSLNTAIGDSALINTTGGTGNTASGYLSMAANTEGNSNTAFGRNSINGNTTGNQNTAVGSNAMQASTTGSNNVAVGYSALFSSGSYSKNTAIGNKAGEGSWGTGNVFIGNEAAQSEGAIDNKLYIDNTNADADNALIYGEFGTDNTTSGNILRTNAEFQIGNPTGTGYAFPITDGSNGQVMTTDGAGNVTFQNVVGDGTGDDWSLTGNNALSTQFIGTINVRDLKFRSANTEYMSLSTNGQLEFFNTSESIKIGESAGDGAGGPGISRNVFVGHEVARFQGTTSLDNIGIGHEALRTITGSSNIAIGSNALRNTQSSQNVGIGSSALFTNSTGTSNTAIGYVSFRDNTSGENNVGVGSLSGRLNSTGSNNTFLGTNSGFSSTGDNNVFVGYLSGSNETGDNKLYIENSNADSDNALIYGEFDNNILRANGELQIGNPTGTGYAFPTTDGTNGQVITTDGAGNLTFQNSFTDSDWFEVGSTNPPNGINDDKYTGGSLSIGKNTAAVGLVDLENDNKDTTLSLSNTYEPFIISAKYGIQNTMNSTQQNTAILNELLGNSASKTAINNFFSGNMSLGLSLGFSNRFENTGGANQIGVYNTFASTSSTGQITGLRNWFQNGSNYTSFITGIKNDFNLDANGEHTAIINTFTGTGIGIKYGVKNIYSGTGSGIFYGNFTELTNTGSADKYGHYVDILNTAGGTHYGYYADVQSASGYAAYFIGRTELGNGTTNRYLMPAADGTNGQVLTTDGAGNTSWQDIATPSLSLARITMSANQSIGTTGWQKLDFDTVDFDLNSNFDTLNDEFDIATTGYYRINATWRSATTSTSTNAFGIAIAVNGSIERAKLYSHNGNGLILRSINSVLDLNAGERVEIYIYSLDTITAFNNDIPVSFEIEQIR